MCYNFGHGRPGTERAFSIQEEEILELGRIQVSQFPVLHSVTWLEI
jgi:hypothetical protein